MPQKKWIVESAGVEAPPVEQPTDNPTIGLPGPATITSDSPLQRFTRNTLSYLPAIGGTLGALVGGGAGLLGGPAAPATSTMGAVGGAGMGGMAGESLRQLMARGLYGESAAPTTSQEATTAITQQGTYNALAELLGLGVARTAPGLMRSAESRYARALSPSGTASKVYAQEAAAEMAQRSMRPRGAESLKALAEQQTKTLGPQVGAEVRAAEAAHQATAGAPASQRALTSPDAYAISQELMKRRRQEFIKGTTTPGNEAAIKNIDAQIEKLRDVMHQQGRFLSPESVVSWKRILQEQVSEGFTKDLADASAAEAYKRTSRILAKELDSKAPDLAKIDAEFAFWATIRDLTRARAVKEVGKTPSKLGSYAAAASALGMGGVGGYFGGTSGALGGFLGTGAAIKFVQAVNSPGWQMTSGYLRSKLAKAVANRNTKDVIAISTRILNAPSIPQPPQTPPQQ